MRNKILYISGFILCLLALIHYSCRKESDSFGPGDQLVRTDLSGHIIDENKLPVQGALVVSGSATTVTDEKGNFLFNNILLNADAGFIKVEKAGYFPGSRTILPQPNTSHYVEMELIPKTISGSFVSTANALITLGNGGAIQLAANSIISTSTSTPYNGEVFVSAFYLNPEASNFGALMPGDLRGLTTSNEQKGLRSFGMMAVEMWGTNSEKINLAPGKTATLIFPIPAALLDEAPGTIPLWRFDEDRGLWKEEGTASKQGNNYVGVVSHFSFWNCDQPYPLVDFSTTINDRSSLPMPGVKVVIRIAGDSATTSGSGYTDTAGRISGEVPANKNLQLVVYNACGAQVYSQNIGPFSRSANLGIQTVDNSSQSSISLTGNVTNCSGNPVANGYVTILVNGKNYRTNITNGTYSLSVPVCFSGNHTISLTPFDQSTNQYGTQMTVTVNSSTTKTINLVAC